jgi:hypothetical protein
MTSTALTLAAALAAMTPPQRDHAEMVILTNSIGAVESGMNYAAKGDGGKAVGAFQMHPAAWITANQWLAKNGLPTVSRKQWRVPDNQRAAALAYVKWCRERIVSDGIANPTPEQIYLAYSMGYSAAKAANHSLVNAPKAKADAAERVGNIYRELVLGK